MWKDDLDTPMSLETTSMVDVIFILLAFFVVVSQLKEYNLPLNLPEASSAEGAPQRKAKKPLLIQLNAKGELYLYDQRSSISQLEQQLQRQKARPVQIRPDRKAPTGALVQVLDLLRKYKWSQVEVKVKRKGRS